MRKRSDTNGAQLASTPEPGGTRAECGHRRARHDLRGAERRQQHRPAQGRAVEGHRTVVADDQIGRHERVSADSRLSPLADTVIRNRSDNAE
jgi:hypothetical protein